MLGYTNGYYDLFHVGHLRLIQKAAERCSRLIVGVIDDETSMKNKGKKPIVPMQQRMEIISGIKGVGEVVPVYNDDKFLEWEKYHYDTLFVGSDHQGEKIWIENENRLKNKAKVVYLPYTELISTTQIQESMKPLVLSILICHLKDRKKYLNRLLPGLKKQCEGKPVEILIEEDNGEITTGEKRNRLVEKARGEYVCFVDDDDMLPEYYVDEILKATISKPDCIGFWGEIQIRPGSNIQRSKYYLNCERWRKDGDIFHRSIGQLNPIRREIASKVKFPNKTIGEDHDHAKEIQKLLKTEVFIDKIMYHYYPFKDWKNDFKGKESESKGVVVGIPSGYRIESARKVFQEWANKGVKSYVVTWDPSYIGHFPEDRLFVIPERRSWGSNHNYLASILEWDVYVSTNDDTFPIRGIENIQRLANEHGGCVLYPNTPPIFLCFPIITKEWYLQHNSRIFDEKYIHNFADNDVLEAALKEGKAINCPDILFEHRQEVNEKYRDVMKQCNENFKIDQQYFNHKWNLQKPSNSPTKIVRIA